MRRTATGWRRPDVEPTAEQVEAGHAVYTKRLLAIYDVVVLQLLCRLVWRCPSRRIVELYNAHVSANHLDVGVGTGYFLDRCRFPPGDVRLALLDLNPNCLGRSARRLARYRPEIHRANALEPIRVRTSRFDSVAMSYILHCLPGTIRSKAVVFDNLKALLNPGGVIFGATVLHGGVERNRLARTLARRYNAHGIFTNTHDDLDGLRSVLAQRLSNLTLDVVGCVAIFSGRA